MVIDEPSSDSDMKARKGNELLKVSGNESNDAASADEVFEETGCGNEAPRTPLPPPEAFRSLPLSSGAASLSTSKQMLDLKFGVSKSDEFSQKKNGGGQDTKATSLQEVIGLSSNSAQRQFPEKIKPSSSDATCTTLTSAETSAITSSVSLLEVPKNEVVDGVNKKQDENLVANPPRTQVATAATIAPGLASINDSTVSRSFEEEDHSSVTSSVSLPRSLQPRTLAEFESGKEQLHLQQQKVMDFLIGPSGSRSPSVLSSRDSDGGAVEADDNREQVRMRHLGALLDRTHKIISKDQSDNNADDDMISQERDINIESGKDGGGPDEAQEGGVTESKTVLTEDDLSNDARLHSFASDPSEDAHIAEESNGQDKNIQKINQAKDIGAGAASSTISTDIATRSAALIPSSSQKKNSSGTTATTQKLQSSLGNGNNSSPTSLFENLDRNWSSLHPNINTSKGITSVNREKLCFGSLVAVLLDDTSGSKSTFAGTSFKHGLFGKCTGSNSLSLSTRDCGTTNTTSVALEVVKLFWKFVILPTTRLTLDDCSESDKNVIEEDEEDAQMVMMMEQVLSTLLERLNYLILVPSSMPSLCKEKQGKTNSVMMVQVSHEVYSDYGKHILHSMGVTQKQVEEWHTKFASVLEEALLVSSSKKSDSDNLSKGSHPIPAEIQIYAALYVPQHTISLYHHSFNDSSGASTKTTQSQQKRRNEFIAKLMRLLSNPKFVSRRMEVLAFATGHGTLSSSSISSDEKDGKRKKKKSPAVISASFANNWNILKATAIHIADLEKCISFLSPISTEMSKLSGDEKTANDGDVAENIKEYEKQTLRTTQSVLSMYGAWKAECIAVLSKVRKEMEGEIEKTPVTLKRKSKNKKKKKPSTISSSSVDKTNIDENGNANGSSSNVCSGTDSDPAVAANGNQIDDSMQTTESKNIFQEKKENPSATLQKNSLSSQQRGKSRKSRNSVAHISYSESLSKSTKNAHPPPGEYELDPPSITSSLSDTTDGSNKLPSSLGVIGKRGQRRKSRYSRGHHWMSPFDKSTQGGIESLGSVVGHGMNLSDVLEIDIGLLYLEVTVGKAIYLLNQSLSKASTSDSRYNTNGVSKRTVYGAVTSTAKIKFLTSAIEAYSNVTNILSYLLSEDLNEIDEDDLADLGYYYDKKSGSMDPTSRLEKLSYDRIEARILIDKLQILISESWLSLGTCLLNAASDGHSIFAELAKMSLFSSLNNAGTSHNEGLSTVVESTHSSEDNSSAEKRESKQTQSWQGQVMHCFQAALSFLKNNSLETNSSSSHDGDMEMYKRGLHASITHSIGVHYYEQEGNNEMALSCLNDALKRRRHLLQQLQNSKSDDRKDCSSAVGGRTSFRTGKRGGKSFVGHDNGHGTSRNNRPNRHGTNNGNSSDSHYSKDRKNKSGYGDENFHKNDLLLAATMSRKGQLQELEISLSTTLEYAALTNHSLSDYQTSLSLFQEALILRALHVGKNSLDAASLQYNMGVVHDDLGQHEASLGRYGESLRVRLSLLEEIKEDPESLKNINNSSLSKMNINLDELEASVILTLRCMGNVYRALKDPTNAMGCYLKAIGLLKEKLKNQRTSTSTGIYQSLGGDLGFGIGKGGKPLDLPMPIMVVDEMRETEESESLSVKVISSAQCIAAKSYGKRSSGLSEDDKIRKDIANMYTTVASLIELRKEQDSSNRGSSSKGGYQSSSGYSSGGYGSSSSVRSYSSGYRSTSRSAKGKQEQTDEKDSNENIMLNVVYNLGMLTMHFGEYRNAIFYFEEGLRALWILHPNGSGSESSDSDSSYSRKSSSGRDKRRSVSRRSAMRGEIEEGVLYHALAVSNAALADHERAVRCYVTSLRYYRRRFGMEHWKVAGALYDCGLSYWSLGEHNRAGEFWADCLKILLFKGNSGDNMLGISKDLYIANTLYNLAASKCSNGEYTDPHTMTCITDALSIFKHHEEGIRNNSDCKDIAHCYFYLGLVHYKLAFSDSSSSTNNRKTEVAQDKETPDTSVDQIIEAPKNNSSDLSSRHRHLHYALSCVDESLNMYLTGPGIDIIDKTQQAASLGQKLHHPMQAHIAHVSGLIHDALGNVPQALWNYTTAIRLFNRIYSAKNIYSASVMHSMGNLFVEMNNISAAMKCFFDSLSIRRPLLGPMHIAVSETLHNLAGLHSRLFEYTQCIDMYAQCLQIRMKKEGNDGSGVADTLLNMGIVHARFGSFQKSMECLGGALKIRKSRVHNLERTMEDKSKSKPKGEGEPDQNDFDTDELESEESELASVLHNLGNIHLKNNQLDVALRCYEETLNIRRKNCGFGMGGYAEISQNAESEKILLEKKLYLQAMADTLHNIGWAYELKMMYEKALSCFNEALIIKRSLASNSSQSKRNSIETAIIPNNDYVDSSNTLSSAITLLRIGSVHVKLSNFDIGLSYYETALRIQRRQLGRDHIAVARTLSDMGHILKERLDYMRQYNIGGLSAPKSDQIAMKCFNEALRISKRRFGPYHATVAGVMYDMGTIHDLQGDHEKAVGCYKHSLKVYGRKYATGLCRRLTNGVNKSSITSFGTIDDNDQELFSPTGLSNRFTNGGGDGSGFPSPFSIKSQGYKYDADKQQYFKVSEALRNSILRSGAMSNRSWLGLLDSSHMSGSDVCLAKMELFLLRILEFFTLYGVDPVRDSFGNYTRSLLRQIEKARSHATIRAQDTMAYQFLYVIQD